jgi:hypothetical protein
LGFSSGDRPKNGGPRLGDAKLGTQLCTNLFPRPRLGWIFAVGFQPAAKLLLLRVGDYDVVCRRERLCPEPSDVGELVRRGQVVKTRWWDGQRLRHNLSVPAAFESGKRTASERCASANASTPWPGENGSKLLRVDGAVRRARKR